MRNVYTEGFFFAEFVGPPDNIDRGGHFHVPDSPNFGYLPSPDRPDPSRPGWVKKVLKMDFGRFWEFLRLCVLCDGTGTPEMTSLSALWILRSLHMFFVVLCIKYMVILSKIT